MHSLQPEVTTRQKHAALFGATAVHAAFGDVELAQITLRGKSLQLRRSSLLGAVTISCQPPQPYVSTMHKHAELRERGLPCRILPRCATVSKTWAEDMILHVHVRVCVAPCVVLEVQPMLFHSKRYHRPCTSRGFCSARMSSTK